MKRFEIREGSMSGHCCFVGTLFDSKTGATYEFFHMEDAPEICDALNEYEENKKEIERLKYDVKHWKEARDVALAGVEILKDERDALRKELNITKEEIKRLRVEID